MISNIELCQQRPISGGADRNVSAFPVRCDLNACLQTVTDPLQAPVVNKAHQSSRLRQRAEVSSSPVCWFACVSPRDHCSALYSQPRGVQLPLDNDARKLSPVVEPQQCFTFFLRDGVLCSTTGRRFRPVAADAVTYATSKGSCPRRWARDLRSSPFQAMLSDSTSRARSVLVCWM
jgi:hypothetical protein